MIGQSRAPAVVPRGYRIIQIECGSAIMADLPGGLRVMFSVDHREDGEYRHMSISRRDRYPSWEEMKEMCYESGLFSPHDDVHMILSAKSRPEEYVNTHNNCFHWQQKC